MVKSKTTKVWVARGQKNDGLHAEREVSLFPGHKARPTFTEYGDPKGPETLVEFLCYDVWRYRGPALQPGEVKLVEITITEVGE